jgi:hypothetical protein
MRNLTNMNIDLCGRLSIEAYPKMNIYQNGEFVETFKKSRDHDLLTEFMAQYLRSTPTEASEPVKTEPPLNPLGELLILTDENFQEVINKGQVFVKFYAPWYPFSTSPDTPCSPFSGVVTARSLLLLGFNSLNR